MRDIRLEVRSFAAVALMWTATSTIAGPVIYASVDPATSKGTELYVIDPIAATITMLKGVGVGAGGVGTYGGAYGVGGYANTSSGTGGDTGVAGANFSPLAAASLGGSRFGGPTPVDTNSSIDPNSSNDPITAAELITPSTHSIDIVPLRTSMPSEGSQPLAFAGSGRKLAATPSPQSDLRSGCSGDCGESADDTRFPRSLLSFSPRSGCADDCGELPEVAEAARLAGSLVSFSPRSGCNDNCGELAEVAEAARFAPSLLSSCVGNCGGVASLAGGGLQISAVPEPDLLALLGVGFAAAGLARRRKTLTA